MLFCARAVSTAGSVACSVNMRKQLYPFQPALHVLARQRSYATRNGLASLVQDKSAYAGARESRFEDNATCYLPHAWASAMAAHPFAPQGWRPLDPMNITQNVFQLLTTFTSMLKIQVENPASATHGSQYHTRQHFCCPRPRTKSPAPSNLRRNKQLQTTQPTLRQIETADGNISGAYGLQQRPRTRQLQTPRTSSVPGSSCGMPKAHNPRHKTFKRRHIFVAPHSTPTDDSKRP